MRAILLSLVVGLCLSACAGGTTLILMPEADGKVGAVVVKTKNDMRVVDKAYQSVTVSARGLSRTDAVSEADVRRDYAALLEAEPPPPLSFTIYFVTGSSELVETSQALIPQIVDRIKKHLPTEISIIGHTDTTGSDSINDRLALKRAKDVRKMLIDRIPNLNVVMIQSFGSKEPLIPTPPNVDEPRNRRVEILIL